ncbi:MAG: hypothetical protein KCHDKBKB_01910 [Elusimicrobia bacterium]|nr:hypothetical protein [Elusimicrobiota bacterium]
MPLVGDQMYRVLRFQFLGFLLFAISGSVSAGDITSTYTELSSKECIALPSREEPIGEEGGLRCKGPSGYEVMTSYGDARASVSVITPDGKQHHLNYWDVVTHYFSSLGPRAEWRMKGGIPSALIVRVIAHENPEQPSETTSYLAVAKITKDQICVTDRIKADGKENISARKAADVSQGKECLGTAPF